MSKSRLPWIDDHPVAAFFVGAYAYTWIISAPALFMEPSWTAAILIYVDRWRVSSPGNSRR